MDSELSRGTSVSSWEMREGQVSSYPHSSLTHFYPQSIHKHQPLGLTQVRGWSQSSHPRQNRALALFMIIGSLSILLLKKGKINPSNNRVKIYNTQIKANTRREELHQAVIKRTI